MYPPVSQDYDQNHNFYKKKGRLAYKAQDPRAETSGLVVHQSLRCDERKHTDERNALIIWKDASVAVLWRSSDAPVTQRFVSLHFTRNAIKNIPNSIVRHIKHGTDSHRETFVEGEEVRKRLACLPLSLLLTSLNREMKLLKLWNIFTGRKQINA